MLKGPKAILSSAIATALDEFFVVDKKSIESNLLVDTRIVLHEIQLRPLQGLKLPNCVAQVEGSIQRAVFSWNWGKSKDTGGWVKDVILTIDGLEVIVYLSNVPEAFSSTPSNEDAAESEEFFDCNEQLYPSSSAEAIAQAAETHAMEGEIQQQGGIYGYVQKQVKLIIDSLKVQVEHFQLTIHLPSSAGDVNMKDGKHTFLQVRGEAVELISLGRMLPKDVSVSASLQQTAHLKSLSSQICIDGVIYPLLDSFSYTATSKRAEGKRFDTLLRNLQVTGYSEGQLGVHLGSLQLSALSQLLVLFLAPPDAHIDSSQQENDSKSILEKKSTVHQIEDPPTSFEFNLASLTLEMDGTTLDLRRARFDYCVDGTVMNLTAKAFDANGGARVFVTGIQLQLTSPITMEMESIAVFEVPGVVKLTKPIVNPKIVKEGSTFSLEVDSIEAMVLEAKGKNEKAASHEKEVEAELIQEPSLGERGDIHVLFPFSISLNRLRLTKEVDEQHQIDLKRVNLHANPIAQGAELALEVGVLQNHMLRLEDTILFGISDKPHQISNLRLNVKHAEVTAGYTIQDWQKAITLVDPQDSAAPPTLWKLPHAHVDPIKLTISVKGGVSVKDTKVTVGAFRGNAETTQKELFTYYAQNCLARMADFIPNAEVWGLNIVDSTVNFIAAATPLGPIGGMATIGIIDGVKASIAAGKKRRNVDEGAKTHPLDVFRGVAYAVKDAGHTCVTNPLGVVRDTTTGTEDYVNGNKARLAGAGAGGAAMLVGAVLAGPIGAIAAGVTAQVVTTKAVQRLEKAKEKRQQQEQQHETATGAAT